MENNSKTAKAKELLSKAKSKAVKTLDQNDDGKFDAKDASLIQAAVNEVTSKTAKKVKKHMDNVKTEMDLNKLQPIFLDEIESDDFAMPRFIQVCEMDKRHAESDLCKDSIGHYTGQYENRVLTIYSNKLSNFGIELYPDEFGEFYYMDPCDRSRYIALESYFIYLKAERISELQKIAQDLGAKYFKITYREKKATFTKSNINTNLSANIDTKIKSNTKKQEIASVEAGRTHQEDKFVATNIEAENSFPGCEPIEPKLKYLQNDPVIKNLIEMRLNADSPLGKQKITIEFQNSCGIKEQDAIKIDGFLKGIKAAGSLSVSHEVQNEQRRIFEYEIEF